MCCGCSWCLSCGAGRISMWRGLCRRRQPGGEENLCLIRVAILEEWPSLRSFHVLPYLCERFEVTYITTGKALPDAPFKDVITFPDPRFHLQRALSFSRCTDALYRDKKIDFAYSYACIGFLIRQAP